MDRADAVEGSDEEENSASGSGTEASTSDSEGEGSEGGAGRRMMGKKAAAKLQAAAAGILEGAVLSLVPLLSIPHAFTHHSPLPLPKLWAHVA